ncbi:hypothetical protein BLOT_007388 [Blomia tropicalis]|nr:hypothetical protein BLOT_007388 [Blomia tropicalis]
MNLLLSLVSVFFKECFIYVLTWFEGTESSLCTKLCMLKAYKQINGKETKDNPLKLRLYDEIN